jgi:8-oxo-dGTP diphosphatase
VAELIHVVVAVIRDRRGEILIARRGDDKHQGGRWEFPGGKVEPGESPAQALRRELREELGIEPTQGRPLIQIPYHYPDRSVWLDVWEVTAFVGEARGVEGQPIRWVPPHALDHYPFPAANTPIITAARLSPRLLITADGAAPADYGDKLQRAFQRGISQVILRAKSLDEAAFAELYRQLHPLSVRFNARLGVNASLEQAHALGVEHLHLTSARLQALASRAQFKGRWLSASCHDAQQIRMAQEKGVDFITLSPVKPTRSHPGAPVLGWERFAALVAECRLPVYALGGLDEDDLLQAQRSGAQGIAAISAWW